MVTKYDTGDVVLIPVELDSAGIYADEILYTPDNREGMGDRTFLEKKITGLAEGGNSLCISNEIKRALEVLSCLSEKVTGPHTFFPLTAEQREAIDTLWSDLHSRHPLDNNFLNLGLYGCLHACSHHVKSNDSATDVTCGSEKAAETVKCGRWEKSDIPDEKFVCSECGGACWYYDYEGDVAKSRYCPNCGARMENYK